MQASMFEGGCLCNSVRFVLRGEILSAGYCHCTHCQRRTGTGSSANCRVARESLRVLCGEEHLRIFRPSRGVPKLFCGICGSALFSGDLERDEQVAIRLGAFDRDPGVRPQYRQFVRSAVPWEPLPEDSLTRFEGSRFS